MRSFGTRLLVSVGKTKHPYNFQLVSCLSPHSNTQAILGFASSTVGSKGVKYPFDPTVIFLRLNVGTLWGEDGFIYWKTKCAT